MPYLSILTNRIAIIIGDNGSCRGHYAGETDFTLVGNNQINYSCTGIQSRFGETSREDFNGLKKPVSVMLMEAQNEQIC